MRFLRDKRYLRLLAIFTGYILYTLTWGADQARAASGGHGGEIADVLLGLIIILLAAKLGGDLLERFHQPAVLGELLFGIIIGNLVLVGVDTFEPFKHSLTLEVLSELGVIILLFEVGLESSLDEMLSVGFTSLLVALFGVILPFFLGLGVGAWLLPESSIYVHIFIGATLTATSVGITARVLKDLDKIKSREAKIILGAAVIDDILGLIILAVVIGVIQAASSGTTLGLGNVILILAKAFGFVAAAVVIGRLAMPRVFKIGSRLKSEGILLSAALMICFIFAFLAGAIGLAPIVGAFAAGLVLDKVHYKEFTERGEHHVEELIKPIGLFLIPIFFVRMGMMVDLATFGQIEILLLAGAITLAAFIGKQACSLAIFDKVTNRLAVGLGMVPRGEVGLIFAGIGAKISIGEEPLVSPGEYSAIVIMVIVTTLVTPPFLKWSLLRGEKK